MLHELRCRIGIFLKLAGCALIHGRGRHFYGPEPKDMDVVTCKSCGMYKERDMSRDF